MKIVFRADASQALGSGHVMRCACLADQLQQRGARTSFACLDLPQHLERRLVAAGHAVLRLPEAVRGQPLADAQATFDLAGDTDRWVLDHYGLGAEWERLAQANAPVLAIDDLGRPHVARWLLDQNFYADGAARYQGRLGPGTTALLGPQHALLRPGFAAARSLARPRSQGLRRVLVFLGAMDADNVTALALHAIDLAALASVAVDVVAGASHPDLPGLADWCGARANAQLHVQIDDIERLMLAADLAIGAGGSSTWERCALGLPTITVCLADNQREVVREGARAGFLWGIERVPAASELAAILQVLAGAPQVLEGLSVRALAVCDARGASRVAAALMPAAVRVRPATVRDARAIYDWRSHPAIQAASRSSDAFSFEAHCAWLERVLADPSRLLLVGVHGQPDQAQDIGVVRFDTTGERAEVSVFLAPDQLGSGLGEALLRAAQAHLQAVHPGIRWLDAWVNEGNQASARLFERLGYSAKIRRLELEII